MKGAGAMDILAFVAWLERAVTEEIAASEDAFKFDPPVQLPENLKGCIEDGRMCQSSGKFSFLVKNGAVVSARRTHRS